jgi:hypothetical protein
MFSLSRNPGYNLIRRRPCAKRVPAPGTVRPGGRYRYQSACVRLLEVLAAMGS